MSTTAAADAPPLRPLRLFAHPEPVEAMSQLPDGPPLHFRWRRMLHRVLRAEGPQRLLAPWWPGVRQVDRQNERPRDYFRVEDEHGRRFWLYRDGFYGGETPPRWFMHGLFA